MQDKPLNKIIDSLGGKKKGRKRKKEAVPTPMSEVEFFNAIQTTSKSTGFDQEKLESISETKEVSYEKDFSELKEMVQKVLSKNTSKDTKFKKIDPRDIKKLDKYTFKTAVIKTEKGITQLPALRTGGVVTSPTQALIGENGPEAIVPLEKLQKLYELMPNMSRDTFGTLAQKFAPNADRFQVDSMFGQITGSKDPAKLLSKKDFRDREEILNLMGLAEKRPDFADEFLKTAERKNPKVFRQIQREREDADDQKAYEKRMESIRRKDPMPGEPGFEERKKLEKMLAEKAKFEADREKARQERKERLAALERKQEESRFEPTPSSARAGGIELDEMKSGVGGLSYDELMDPNYFKNKFSEEETKKITDRAARKRRGEKRFADEFVDRKLEERYKNMELDPGRTFGDFFEVAGRGLGGVGKSIGGMLGGLPKLLLGSAYDKIGHDERPNIFTLGGGMVPDDHPFKTGEPMPGRNEPVFKGPDVNPAMFSKNVAALQELQERYKQSQSGREQTSRANTPRVQPSNPAKVKTPHATGIGGGGGGQNLFEMIGMSMQMFPLWRAKNG